VHEANVIRGKPDRGTADFVRFTDALVGNELTGTSSDRWVIFQLLYLTK
jgi:hypothetical protein